MRGFEEQRDGLCSYVWPESRIPKNHPLRVIRTLADKALAALDAQFAQLYAENDRPSIPSEQLLRALLRQAIYTIRSERQLMEQRNYNLLFRWFAGLSVDAPVWVPTVFSKNRGLLLEGGIAAAFNVGGAEPAAGAGPGVGRAFLGGDRVCIEDWCLQRPRQQQPGIGDHQLADLLVRTCHERYERLPSVTI